MPTDADLVRRAQAGDQDAFDELVGRHARMVLSLARRITGDRTEADDVAQETFLRLHRTLDRVDPERPLEPWLVRLTINAARRHVARRAGRREQELTGDWSSAESSSDPSRPLEQAQLRAALDAAIADLPEREREVFLLRDLQGVEVAVIAEALGVSEVTVRRQSTEARRKVAAWLRARRPELLR